MKGNNKMEKFETLPNEIQDKVKYFLQAYSNITVTYFGGKYCVETGTCLMGYYPNDYRFIGTFTKKDIKD